MIEIIGWSIWLIGAFLAAEFIIRWNRRWLKQNSSISLAQLTLARKLNADLKLYTTNVWVWRFILICMGPVTIFKAIMLRIRGGSG